MRLNKYKSLGLNSAKSKYKQQQNSRCWVTLTKGMIKIWVTANCTSAIFPTFCLPIVEYHAKFNLPNTNTSIVFYYVVQLLLLPFFAIATDQIGQYRAKCNLAIKTALSISSQTLTSQKAFSIFFYANSRDWVARKIQQIEANTNKAEENKKHQTFEELTWLKEAGIEAWKSCWGGEERPSR